MASATTMRAVCAHSSSALARRITVQQRTAFRAPAAELRPALRCSTVVAAAAAADLPTATDAPSMRSNELPAAIDLMNAARKLLRSLGWEDAWIDGIVSEIRKGKLRSTPAEMEAIVNYLTEEVNIPMKRVENMAAVAPELLGSPLEQVQGVLAYARQQGLAGDALVQLLEVHPKLLTFSAAADSKALQKGAARASIDLVERQGRRVAGVSYWREGAAFQTAPVAPRKPSAL